MIRELLVLLVVATAVSEAVVCDLTTCASFRCGVPNCPDGYTVKKRGGFCGCCDNCVPALEEGETCNPDSLIGGYPYHNGVTNSDPMCGPGLKCSPTAKVCVQKGRRNRTSNNTPVPSPEPEPAASSPEAEPPTVPAATTPQPTQPAGK